MPCKRFTNERTAFALRQAENGATVDEVCRTRVDLIRAGRDPIDLACKFEPSAQTTIRNWMAETDRSEGRCEVKPPA